MALLARALAAMLLVASAGALHAQPPLLGAPPVVREVQDWLLVCDNTRVCRTQPKSQSGSLMVRRDPGPDGVLLVQLNAQEPRPATRLDRSSIAIAGTSPGPAAPWLLDERGETALLRDESALAFLRAAVDAERLTYKADGAELEVPLSGLKAALAGMDEAQGLDGTTRAFVRPGSRSPDQALPPLAVPVLTISRPPRSPVLPGEFAAQVRQASRDLLAAQGCDKTPRGSAGEAYALTDTEALVILECGYGAVHTSFLLVRASRGPQLQVQHIRLPRRPGRDEDYEHGSAVYTTVDWDPQSATLTSEGWSCAHACGTTSSWAFDGSDFVVASHLIYEPGGAEVLEIYRTEVRVGG